MVYILSVFFVIIGIINIVRGRNIKIRPGINKMDIISSIMVAVIFLAFGFFLKSSLVETLVMSSAVIFYMLSTRYARGITDRGVVISGGNLLFLREYLFSQLKQVNVSNDGDLVSFAIVIAQKNFVDIQRYPKEMKADLIKIFKDEHVTIIYK